MKKIILGLIVILLLLGIVSCGPAKIVDNKIEDFYGPFVYYDRTTLLDYTYNVIHVGKSTNTYQEAKFTEYILRGDFFVWRANSIVDSGWSRLDINREYYIYKGSTSGRTTNYLLSTIDIFAEK